MGTVIPPKRLSVLYLDIAKRAGGFALAAAYAGIGNGKRPGLDADPIE